jgi:hypothetical protein
MLQTASESVTNTLNTVKSAKSYGQVAEQPAQKLGPTLNLLFWASHKTCSFLGHSAYGPK